MIIKYTNTKEDILSEYLFLINRTEEHKKDLKSMRNLYFIFAAIMAGLSVFYFIKFMGNQESETLMRAISQFTVALITLGFGFVAPKIRQFLDVITLKGKIKKENREYKENVIEINDKQIKYYGDKNGVIKATEQKLIHEDKKYLFIVARKGTLTIPKNAIENLDKFKKLVRGKQI